MESAKKTLSLTYDEAIDHFRSMVSYLSELKKSDQRSTTQWYHLERDLKKNLKLFYTKYISVYGDEKLKQEFKEYYVNIKPQNRKDKKSNPETEEHIQEHRGQE